MWRVSVLSHSQFSGQNYFVHMSSSSTKPINDQANVQRSHAASGASSASRRDRRASCCIARAPGITALLCCALLAAAKRSVDIVIMPAKRQSCDHAGSMRFELLRPGSGRHLRLCLLCCVLFSSVLVQLAVSSLSLHCTARRRRRRRKKGPQHRAKARYSFFPSPDFLHRYYLAHSSRPY